jgi:8-oxo-dGTP diphosphatase
VVAAVVGRDDRLLLCQRPDGEHLPLLWEFPGGKIDGDEAPREALRRELAEELGVRSDVGEQVADVTHAYPEKTVRIRFFLAVVHDAPRAIVHRDVRWIPIDELGNYEVPPANRGVVQMIAERSLSLTAR